MNDKRKFKIHFYDIYGHSHTIIRYASDYLECEKNMKIEFGNVDICSIKVIT